MRQGEFEISNLKFEIIKLRRCAWLLSLLVSVFFVSIAPNKALAASADTLFHIGSGAYRAGDFTRAAQAFRQAANVEPASGTLQNLGNAEWQCGQTGPAILAW